ncbi:ABC transporter permease [Marinithermus hydrothermalis]|uniref:ABC-type transporter, integral membrane subunit n=1 Tax=Marinithermus hydrothermalis (strain DSM 14884 / JCM 11576 / T1) TaxID=869210 RepID=F2NKB3_MARHT|nr:ABC transporter permease [Marinithermus hydrothermalis]AEB12362.1 ABC-type transporter, integral membrane subunit [Marinithermus hydrothermalis DSM 14884]
MASAANAKPVRGESTWALAWRRFRKHRMAMFSLGVIFLLVLSAVFAPQIAPYDPNAQPTGPDLASKYFLPPLSEGHLLGTDELGRDVLSRILYGGRISLLVGFSVAISSVFIGTLIGALAGYFSGRPFQFYTGPFSDRFQAAWRAAAPGVRAAGVGAFLVAGLLGAWIYAGGGAGGFALYALAFFAGLLILQALGGMAAQLARIAWAFVSWGLLLAVVWGVWDLAYTLAAPALKEGGLNGTLSAVGLGLTGLVGLGIAVWGVRGVLYLDLDTIISRIIDFMLSIPSFPILLVLSAFMRNPDSPLGAFAQNTFGESASVFIIIFILVIFGWITTARLVRGQILSIREQEYALAATALGASEGRILFRHLVPNTLAPIIVEATLQVGTAILVEAALSFLGFGIQPPVATWGNMLTGAQDFIFFAPTLAIFPGVMIVLTVLAFNYVGDGLRDALDPRSRL